jgi:IS30 family transposase
MAYHQLTLSERAIISVCVERGIKKVEIARLLGRARSTVSRELARNRARRGGYSFQGAQRSLRNRRANARPRLLGHGQQRGDLVWRCLRKGWSPEQIVGRLKLDFDAKPVGFRTIYRWIDRLRRARDPILKQLPRCPRKRRYRGRRGQPQAIVGRVGIEHRPAEAQTRQVLGHWEGDTLMSSPGKPAIVTFVERKTRYLVAKKLTAGGAAHLSQVAIEALRRGTRGKRKTITLDNGSEFADFRTLQRHLNVLVFFSDPGCPWQRPTIENTNGLLRDFLPKKTDLHKLGPKALARIVGLLNNRPRKCLNWRTPAEVFG